MSKSKKKKPAKTTEQIRKEAVAQADKNIAAIEKRERQQKQAKGIAAADLENAKARDEREAAPDGMTASQRAMAKSAKANPKAASKPAKDKTGKPAAKPAKPQRAKRPRKTGILAIAAEILSASKEPMACADIVKVALEKKMWSTQGRTPASTLYAAVLREIQKKKDQARFKKVDRGMFTTNAGGK